MGTECSLNISPSAKYRDLLTLCDSLERYLTWKHADCQRGIPRIPRLKKRCKKTHKKFNEKYPDVPTYDDVELLGSGDQEKDF